MKLTTKTFLKWILFLSLILNSAINCKKIDTQTNESIENISDLKIRFFNTSKTQDEEIKKLANDIKKQERLLNYLPEFIKKTVCLFGIRCFKN